MKSVQSLLPVFGLFAAAQAWGSGWSNDTVVYETVTVATLTTFCPEATTITQGHKTYTATKSETLTITDCPCTVTKPVKPTYPTSPPTVVAPPPPKPTKPTGNGTYYPPVWVTTTVSEFTTYCPAPTTFVHGNKTYTATESTTLTITDCPCTVSYPAVTSTTVTVSTLTTYCPIPTVITIGPSTYPVTTPGTVTIPIVTVSEVPGTPPTPVAPGITTPAAPGVTTPASGVPAPSGTNVPSGPGAATTTPPLQVTNSGEKVGAGFGALAVAGLAMLL